MMANVSSWSAACPKASRRTTSYEYDHKFEFTKRHVVESGHTRLGIQTAAFSDGRWWFGCYGGQLLECGRNFEMAGRFDFDCSLGIAELPDGSLLVAGGRSDKQNGCSGWVRLADPDRKKGLVVRPKTASLNGAHWRGRQRVDSREQFVDDVAEDVGQAEVATTITIGELLVLEAE